jgi:hypothetical protein
MPGQISNAKKAFATGIKFHIPWKITHRDEYPKAVVSGWKEIQKNFWKNQGVNKPLNPLMKKVF